MKFHLQKFWNRKVWKKITEILRKANQKIKNTVFPILRILNPDKLKIIFRKNLFCFLFILTGSLYPAKNLRAGE